MNVYYDFHIHTALSPCADLDMTPNNIVNMAKIKGLDAIAITDHNSCENAVSCLKIGEEIGLIVIPGMELQTKEEFHCVCLFDELDSALKFQEIIYSKLPLLKNKPDIFGEQIIYDTEDNIIGYNERLLLASADISIEEALNEVINLGGVLIPAHVDRESYSIISSLGFIPKDLDVRFVEYHSMEELYKLIKRRQISEGFRFIKSSDAHYLQDISERESFLSIHVDELNRKNIINYLRGK